MLFLLSAWLVLILWYVRGRFGDASYHANDEQHPHVVGKGARGRCMGRLLQFFPTVAYAIDNPPHESNAVDFCEVFWRW